MGSVRMVKGEADLMLFTHQGTKGTLTTVEVATIHELQLRGKRGFVASLRTYLMFFLPSSGRIPPKLRRNPASLSNKSRSSQKSTYLEPKLLSPS